MIRRKRDRAWIWRPIACAAIFGAWVFFATVHACDLDGTEWHWLGNSHFVDDNGVYHNIGTEVHMKFLEYQPGDYDVIITWAGFVPQYDPTLPIEDNRPSRDESPIWDPDIVTATPAMGSTCRIELEWPDGIPEAKIPPYMISVTTSQGPRGQRVALGHGRSARDMYRVDFMEQTP